MTHNPNDPHLRSWWDVPTHTDFPIQNLPFGIFSTENQPKRVGVALGNHIIDLLKVFDMGFLSDFQREVFCGEFLNRLISLGKTKTNALRRQISFLFTELPSSLEVKVQLMECLVPMELAKLHMPVFIRDYTDFYSSEQHAYNVGCMFRDPENALMPNWKHLPVAYHGRASSLVVSGTPIHRPKGQSKADGALLPSFGPSRSLDFELEMGFILGKPSPLGSNIPTSDAEEYIFGFLLFNDWSARDLQKWEYVPLGPFLGKNFASTVSPWVVTLEALEPFRVDGPKQEPPVLPYLQSKGKKHFDIQLEVWLESAEKQIAVLTQSNYKYLYWNISQQLAHHTINGCNVEVGDLMASGTISGPNKGQFGSMLEITWKGTEPFILPDGSSRKFIEDGDTVILKGYAEANGIRIGFGEARNKILPAV